MRITLRAAILLFLSFGWTVWGQQPNGAAPAASAAPAVGEIAVPAPPIDDKFVHEHFGKEFTLMPEFPAMVGDLNGDGIEDLVLAARAKSPMLDAGGFGYTVSDPYHSFYGFGDPKVTAAFTSDDPTRKSIVLLIIHGAGSEGWRSGTPKGKFVLINIPVQSVSLRRLKMKKKIIMAIGVEEYGGDKTTSAVFFDGNLKKNTGAYKYQPIGASME
jgi:hypothetical protein